MSKTIDIEAVKSLRAFALHQGCANLGHLPRDVSERADLVAFAHLCTAALQGEEWAVERIAPSLSAWDICRLVPNYSAELAMLASIRATDTTRPDGAIAKSITI